MNRITEDLWVGGKILLLLGIALSTKERTNVWGLALVLATFSLLIIGGLVSGVVTLLDKIAVEQNLSNE